MICNSSTQDGHQHAAEMRDDRLDREIRPFAPGVFAKNSGPYYYFTTKAPQRYTDVAYPDGAYLVFGREDAGLPEALLAANQEHCIRMPMRDTCRSLNLSNSVAVGVYEVLRQWDFPELLDHGHLRDYEWK